VATFNFLKSIHIICLPFFLGIITIGDNHVASFIDLTNPTVSISISCLTTVT
jgi:hypothetical protein